MSSEIRPEDIEAAIAAAEQRRRARMAGGADVATASAPTARRPVLPERMVGGAATAEALAREPVKSGAAGAKPLSDDLDDSWLDQPARPKPAMTRRVADLPEAEVAWEPESTRRGLALPFGIGAVALVVFGSILWWAYSSNPEQAGGEVPVIVAEDTPIKEKPAEEGGLEVPDQDKLVYNNIAEGEQGGSQVEQLLPAPEEPVAPPQPEPAATAAVGTAEPVPLVPSADDTDAALADAAPAAATPAPAGLAPEPAQTAAAPSALAAPAAPAPAEPAAPAPTQEAAAAPAAAPVEPAQPAAGKGWKIQLAAVKTEQGARQEWGRMQKVHPDLLSDMNLTVQRADLGTKGIYYRIQAGPLPDRTTAEDVCAELKASQQPCLVVKP
jgi:cell division septation protein DedD